MYKLFIFYDGTEAVGASYDAANAAEALARIPQILADHDGCERVVVFAGPTRLFSVDCQGNRHP